jgi:hypothetical protein
MDSVQVQRLGKSAEIALRVLDKCLPSLKSLEVTKRTEEVITIEQVGEDQRAAINAAISQALGIVDNGGGTPAEGIRCQNNMTPRPRHEFSENEVVDGEYQVLSDSVVGSHSIDSEEET